MLRAWRRGRLNERCWAAIEGAALAAHEQDQRRFLTALAPVDRLPNDWRAGFAAGAGLRLQVLLLQQDSDRTVDDLVAEYAEPFARVTGESAQVLRDTFDAVLLWDGSNDVQGNRLIAYATAALGVAIADANDLAQLRIVVLRQMESQQDALDADMRNADDGVEGAV